MVDSHILRLSVPKLAKVASPFESCVWHIRYPITRVEVARAVEFLRTHTKATRGGKPFNHPSLTDSEAVRWRRVWHVQRVAWLVWNGWDDAIEIDVGVPSLGCNPSWIVLDGNHRLAAAIYRGDETIRASCGGDVEVFRKFLP